MNKLQKKLQQVGIAFKKEHNVRKNMCIWVKLLDGDKKEIGRYIGSAQDIYCRHSLKDYPVKGIAMYVYHDNGYTYGFDPATEKVVMFSELA